MLAPRAEHMASRTSISSAQSAGTVRLVRRVPGHFVRYYVVSLVWILPATVPDVDFLSQHISHVQIS